MMLSEFVGYGRLIGCVAALLAAPAVAQSLPANAGENLYKQRCQMCHTNAADARNGVGPNLYKLRGRTAGTQPGFMYSQALKGSKVIWTKDTLSTFLIAPNKMVPGTRMVVTVPDPEQRKALAAYLTK